MDLSVYRNARAALGWPLLQKSVKLLAKSGMEASDDQITHD